MAHNRSFKEYVASRFYNELYAAIEEYVADNADSLDLRLYEVRTIGEIELSEIDVQFVSVSDLPGSAIAFDVAVEAELYVRERDYHYDDSEECRQWFLVKCMGSLDCSLDEGIVRNYLDMLLPDNWDSMDYYRRREYIRDIDDPTRTEGTVKRQTVSNIEIWCECFGKSKEEIQCICRRMSGSGTRI